MGGNKIISYRNPNDLNELLNKSYELSLGSNPLTDLPEPKYKNDASTKKYVDNGLNSKIYKTLLSDLALNNNKITNLKKATNNQDSVNLEQLNESASVISATTERLFMKKDGSNLDSNLSVNNNKKLLILLYYQMIMMQVIKNIMVKKLVNHILVHMKIVKMFLLIVWTIVNLQLILAYKELIIS